MKAALRLLLACLVVAMFVAAPGRARADENVPAAKLSRNRFCCALASHLPLHLGSTHVPISIRLAVSPMSLGSHSYSGDYALYETNGLVYTKRGGFIDTGHLRDYADLTAYLAVQLRPLLQKGEGVIKVEANGGARRIRITQKVPETALVRTANRIAQRIAFQLSVRAEIVQFYGLGKMKGAEEIYSSFTVEDLYSNLLGTYLGIDALESPLPYDRAMDEAITASLTSLGAVQTAATRETLSSLSGRWWNSEMAWPSPAIAIARSFDLGPRLKPVLAPPDIALATTGDAATDPASLEVPESDGTGGKLEAFYRLEIIPDLAQMPRFATLGLNEVGAEELPRVVDDVRESLDAETARRTRSFDDRGASRQGPLAHYLVGIRLLDIRAVGGATAANAGNPDVAGGAFGGSALVVHGDTRGGDFAAVRFDLHHTHERGIIGGFSLLKADALFFCHDPETGHIRAPLVSLLGPCNRGEWFGIGGSVAEAFHDGKTGRTAIRPVSAYGVLNPFANGQSPSYDGLRLLLRGGGAVEHIWTESNGAHTVPRVGGNAIVLARTPGRSLEARGAVGYRLDPSTPRDAAFESDLSVRWYFLLGGSRSAVRADGIDPWGIASLGIQGGYSYWTRPAHSFAELTLPFTSAVQQGTWQVLVTTTLGFEGFTF